LASPSSAPALFLFIAVAAVVCAVAPLPRAASVVVTAQDVAEVVISAAASSRPLRTSSLAINRFLFLLLLFLLLLLLYVYFSVF
jgi:hypothetical protein